MDECAVNVPELREVAPGQFVACIRTEIAGETLSDAHGKSGKKDHHVEFREDHHVELR